MLGYRERLANDRFIPGELSSIAEALKEKGRNVQIVERSWGGNRANGSYFGGHDEILVEVLGSFPWQRRDLMERSRWVMFPVEFRYREKDKDLSNAVEEAQREFPDSRFSTYQPNDMNFLSWTMQYLQKIEGL